LTSGKVAFYTGLSNAEAGRRRPCGVQACERCDVTTEAGTRTFGSLKLDRAVKFPGSQVSYSGL